MSANYFEKYDTHILQKYVANYFDQQYFERIEKDEGEEEGKRRRGTGKNEGGGFGSVKLDLVTRIQGVTFWRLETGKNVIL